MPDLLTHALVGYVLGNGLSVGLNWIDDRYVTVTMFGALLPDANKLSLLVRDSTMEDLLGVPFSWVALHLPAGSLVVCGIVALVAAESYRARVFALLTVGALTHFSLDALAIFTTGYSYPMLWPAWKYTFPAANLFESSDRVPLLLSGIAAVWVYSFKRYRPDRTAERKDGFG